jgi:hypothetical protein
MHRAPRLTAVAALSASALAAGTLAAGAGGAPATTLPVQIVPLDVTITDEALRLQYKAVAFDSAVQFRIRNRTRAVRSFAIGGQRVKVRAKGYRVLLLQFEIRGAFPYSSSGPKGSKTLKGVLRVV